MVGTYRGKVTRVTAEGVFVEIPTIAARHEFGPLGSAVADPPVGAPVAVTSIENVLDDFVVIAVLPMQSEALQGHLEHIVNGTFDSDVSGWSNDVGASTAWAAPGEAVISIPFTGPSNDGVFYQQDFTLVSGYTYTVRFKVRASLPGNMDVVIRKQVGPFTSYFSQTVAVTTVDQTLAYTFVAAATLTDAEIRFELDGLSEDWVVTLDNISLKGGPLIDVVDSSTVDLTLTGDLATKRLTASVIPAGLVGALSLDNLSDVTVTTPATDHFLQYNGTTWVNVLAVLDKLNDVAITSPADGALLRYNGSTWVNVAVLDLIASAAGTDQLTVRVSGDTQKRLTVNGDGLLEWGSGSATPDTNLYRNAANQLMTDDELWSNRSASGDVSLVARISTDTNPRFTMFADGKMEWGPGGSTARDTNLYRDAANSLKTDDALAVVGAFKVGSGAVQIDPASPVQYAVLGYDGSKFVPGPPGPMVLRCTSQLDKTNTTMSDIPGLSFSVTTDWTYYVIALISYSGPTAGDIKFDWDFTGVVSTDVTRWTLGSQLGTTTNQNTAVTMARRDGSTDVSVGADAGTGSGATAYTEHVVIIPSASGTVKMRAAQDTASGTSSVFTQSKLVVFRGYLGN